MSWLHASFLLFLALSIGCNPATKTKYPSLNLPASELFRLHCSACHGDGSGNGHVAPTLRVRPRNLKRPEWQSSVGDQHIIRVIRDGGVAMNLSPEMPAFRDKLTYQEQQSLLNYLRTLAQLPQQDFQ